MPRGTVIPYDGKRGRVADQVPRRDRTPVHGDDRLGA
jgi:hypothetical protein